MHPFTIKTIPCLQDNYAFLIGNPETGEAALVDVPDASPINEQLAKEGWTLTHVLLTHHHWDHVDGLDNLTGRENVQVIGAAADASRLPPLDLAVMDGATFQLFGQEVQVMDVSGHTVGHIAFVMNGAAFTADSLMTMGCGRLFEGTPAQMWDSMQKLRALPDDTIIYSGHEYTSGNIAFANSLGEDNAALAERTANVKLRRMGGRPTVPSTLAEEKATNPFLRADAPSLQAAIGMAGADPTDVFTEIRKRKDAF
ncbi:MAG: hydroxyacylglutathione hydrolase [Planktomarina sp.]